MFSLIMLKFMLSMSKLVKKRHFVLKKETFTMLLFLAAVNNSLKVPIMLILANCTYIFSEIHNNKYQIEIRLLKNIRA